MIKVSDLNYLWDKYSVDDEEVKDLLVKRFNQISDIYSDEESVVMLEATLHYGYHEDVNFKERMREALDES